MPDIYIDGRKKLDGIVKIQGSKNAVLPIIAATVLINGKTVINNCPDLTDVRCSISILEKLGAKCRFEDNCLTVDCSGIDKSVIDDDLMRQMRSSSLFLGSVLARTGKAVISTPGGCKLGPRPIDIHINSIKELGAVKTEEDGLIIFDAPNGLEGKNIFLSYPSVGATENCIMASVFAKGVTVIENCAKEPEIECLSDFLVSAGAKIYGAGTERIVIEGVKKLSPTVYETDFDRIVAATYISAVAAAGGDIFLEGAEERQLDSVISVFEKTGCEFSRDSRGLRCISRARPKSISCLGSQIYPGFPTDAGPMLISVLSVARGAGVFVENIFENRYAFVGELKKLGAQIKLDKNVALVYGRKKLSGANCCATDLRGGAALVVGGLAASGTTRISGTDYIRRGYENIVKDLTALSASIREL